MATVVQPIPGPERNRVSNRYTGFPEPLSLDRNTTLTHPDADTSPNACLESHDIPLSRTASRLSFRGKRSRSHQKQSPHSTMTVSIPSKKSTAPMVRNSSEMSQDIEYQDSTKVESQAGQPRDSGIDMGRNGFVDEKDVIFGKDGAESVSSYEEDENGGTRKKKRGLRAILHLR